MRGYLLPAVGVHRTQGARRDGVNDGVRRHHILLDQDAAAAIADATAVLEEHRRGLPPCIVTAGAGFAQHHRGYHRGVNVDQRIARGVDIPQFLHRIIPHHRHPSVRVPHPRLQILRPHRDADGEGGHLVGVFHEVGALMVDVNRIVRLELCPRPVERLRFRLRITQRRVRIPPVAVQVHPILRFRRTAGCVPAPEMLAAVGIVGWG